MKGLRLRGGVWYAGTTVRVGKVSRRLRESSGFKEHDKDAAELWLASRIAGIQTELRPRERSADAERLGATAPKPRTSNAKGAAGEAAVIYAVYQAGFSALRPFDGACPYDLVIANREHRLCRVQVKFRAPKGNSLRVPLTTIQLRGGKHINVPISRNFIDAFAIFCPTNGRVYFVPLGNIPEHYTVFTVRITAALSDPNALFDPNLTRALTVASEPLEYK